LNQLIRLPLQGKKTYIFAALLVLNALYTLLTGEQAPTFEDPSAVGGTVGGLLGGGLASLRAGLTGAVDRLEKKVNALLEELAGD
jgi:hypothetical protein